MVSIVHFGRAVAHVAVVHAGSPRRHVRTSKDGRQPRERRCLFAQIPKRHWQQTAFIDPLPLLARPMTSHCFVHCVTADTCDQRGALCWIHRQPSSVHSRSFASLISRRGFVRIKAPLRPWRQPKRVVWLVTYWRVIEGSQVDGAVRARHCRCCLAARVFPHFRMRCGPFQVGVVACRGQTTRQARGLERGCPTSIVTHGRHVSRVLGPSEILRARAPSSL
mmetsp:Transcript_16070/g.39527  ORF Transcript_16070/g.39527 Transcript_16070/m.39527 type:complete len:221 (+) Transcript_16070:841-1503(+)